MAIILASKSPRRTEILHLAGIEHTVIPSNQAEIIAKKVTPKQVVATLAYQKASHIASQYPNDIVIGADTIVVIDAQILGKPHSEQEAIQMLELLSGRTHQVMTGVCIQNSGKMDAFVEVTKVTFTPMTRQEIIAYIQEEQVYDKAGSYAIQGIGCKYIAKIVGDYYNVMGLPICKLNAILKQKGYIS